MIIDTLGSENSIENISILFTYNNFNLLLDCGIKPKIYKNIDAIVITHAHISHCEQIFYILNKGFIGKIFLTNATSIILPYIFKEYFLINFSLTEKFVAKLIDKIKIKFYPLGYNHIIELNDCINIRLKPAYHIIGSSFVEIDIRKKTRIEKKVIYSGDLGPTETPILQSFKSPWRADILILESFFGNKLHPSPTKRKNILENLLNKYDTIIILDTLIGRIQEFIFEIRKISDIPIFFDSPISKEIEKIYNKIKPFFKQEAIKKLKNKEFLFLKNLNSIATETEHKNFLKELKSKKIIVTSGSRYIDYYNKFKDNKNFCFINLKNFYSFSCHADKRNLKNFVKKMRYKPEKIYFIHGKKEAIESLKNEIFSS